MRDAAETAALTRRRKQRANGACSRRAASAACSVASVGPDAGGNRERKVEFSAGDRPVMIVGPGTPVGTGVGSEKIQRFPQAAAVRRLVVPEVHADFLSAQGKAEEGIEM
jgi:hypothetical protein